MAHRIRWWVYAGKERIPRTAIMRGTWGYDATCTCGWDSRTGGAVRRYVAEQVEYHKWEVMRMRLYCRECDGWVQAEADHTDGRPDDTFSCPDCAAPIVCGDCGQEWSGQHTCNVGV